MNLLLLLLFSSTLQQIHLEKNTGRCRTTKRRAEWLLKNGNCGACTTWEYCQLLTKGFTARLLGEAFNLLSLNRFLLCFRNIWSRAVDKFVKANGFVLKKKHHVSIYFRFSSRAYSSACLCAFSPPAAPNPAAK